MKGGENDTVFVGDIDINALREFQRQLFITTRDDKRFKPLPPDFSVDHVLRRINNQSVL